MSQLMSWDTLVLLLGSGSREHSLGTRGASCSWVSRLFWWPELRKTFFFFFFFFKEEKNEHEFILMFPFKIRDERVFTC